MWDSINADPCRICHRAQRPKRSEATLLGKENLHQSLSPGKIEELSFYGSNSPQPPLCTGTSPGHCLHGAGGVTLGRRPLEDYDPNSRDSGYLTNYHDSGKFSSSTLSPRGCSRMSCETGSICSMEDEFMEDFSDLESLEDNLPQDFNKLISGPISLQKSGQKTKISPRELTAIRPLFRRALSLQNDRSTPNSSRVRSCLFKSYVASTEVRPFKRPEPPMELDEAAVSKKSRNDEGEDDGEVPSLVVVPRPFLQRAISATEESIMSAVNRSSAEPDLIGDFSKAFSLPLTQGRHQDLKSITPGTLAQLMKGQFPNVASFTIIDCRYPYEYEGGHIDGAVNIYTKDQCMELFNRFLNANRSNEDPSITRNNILVFHCEFSSERGPNLCRYLRERDRQMNQDTYPTLHYPEVYLLEGGYKNFFEQYSYLCIPIAYKEMLHPEHERDLKYFRLKSKTWNVDTRQRPPSRGNLKRLGL